MATTALLSDTKASSTKKEVIKVTITNSLSMSNSLATENQTPNGNSTNASASKFA